ncbi:MAG: phosphate ABC transporter ATP-binding protein [Coraliomargaritaceae bacterium]
MKESLNAVDLWEELKDSLNLSAYQLTKNQQKRLCIARAIALKPEVLLLDEPCATMDTINTGKIEELINQLKKNYTIIIATHNMQQAARISDQAGYLNEGRLIEFNRTDALFMNPVNPETEAYISGRLG